MFDSWIFWLVLLIIHSCTIVFGIPWVLLTKKDPVAAASWCLFVFFVPIFGILIFAWFGYARIERPLKKKRKHRLQHQRRHEPQDVEEEESEPNMIETWHNLGAYSMRVGAFPLTLGNAVEIYNDMGEALEKILEAIREAKDHVHAQYYILLQDSTGEKLRDALTEKAKEGLQVRLLVDGIGTWGISNSWLKPLLDAGAKFASFLPFNPLRTKFRINLRNHRKIVVCDGKVGFTGGMNIGDDTMGKSDAYGPWRDTHVRVEGPAVHSLQEIFREDWDFSLDNEDDWFEGARYFPKGHQVGDALVQVAESGPDREVSVIRELIFAALINARERVWISTPYFIPDHGIRDAIFMLLNRGVDVRVLMPREMDYAIVHYASHYHLNDFVKRGLKLYLYQKGMMHAKTVVVDQDWATVGSMNFDQRSMHLNFEANCMFFSQPEIETVAAHFEEDMKKADLIEPSEIDNRGLIRRVKENISRMFSPAL